MDEPLGLLETTGFTPAMVALDVMAKASPLVVLQAEVNDFLGICIKVVGSLPENHCSSLSVLSAGGDSLCATPNMFP